MAIKVASEGSDTAVDIVLVHGWTSVVNGKNIFGPEAILSRIITRARIIIFDYTAELSEFWAAEADNEIAYKAEDLFCEVMALRTSTKTVWRPEHVVTVDFVNF
ncbi:hypothetical protein FSARC_3765 [Fusarium sarcochroum]|uniref:Uncharacterized protein n=1 Tax=Fusarium sarcochroum TaxID=1208366 RepID=A0A8H4U3Q0_9HYPO|nr:hypothetical protein FSARC_3765 [Fusarium sarcochroum]